jgi:hypothetical protein
MDTQVVVLTEHQLKSIIGDAIRESQSNMVPVIRKAISQARYGEWVRTEDACTILNITHATLIKWRDRQDTEIIYRSEGRVVYYNVESLYNHMEAFGKPNGVTA